MYNYSPTKIKIKILGVNINIEIYNKVINKSVKTKE